MSNWFPGHQEEINKIDLRGLKDLRPGWLLFFLIFIKTHQQYSSHFSLSIRCTFCLFLFFSRKHSYSENFTSLYIYHIMYLHTVHLHLSSNSLTFKVQMTTTSTTLEEINVYIPKVRLEKKTSKGRVNPKYSKNNLANMFTKNRPTKG